MKDIIGYPEVKVAVPFDSEDSEEISHKLNNRFNQNVQLVLDDGEVPKELDWDDVEENDTIVSAELEVEDKEIIYSVKQVPILFDDHQDKFVKVLCSTTRELLEDLEVKEGEDVIDFGTTSTDIMKRDPPEVINPIIDSQVFVSILESMEYELVDTDKDDVIRAEHESMPEVDVLVDNLDDRSADDVKSRTLVLNSNKISILGDNQIEFIDLFSEGMSDLSEEQIRDMDLSLIEKLDVMGRSTVRPWFVKHGVKARQLWENMGDSIFNEDPVCSDVTEMNHLVDDNADRFEFLQVWVDLMRCMKYEITSLDPDNAIDLLEKINRDSDVEFKHMPWRTGCFEVSDSITSEYEKEDFLYDSPSIRDDMLITLENEDDVNIVYEVRGLGYPGDGRYDGTLTPKCWICEPVSATVSNRDSNVHRNELYEKLNSEPSEKILTSEEIRNSKVCTRDATKPSVGIDEFRDEYLRMKQERKLKEKFRETLENGYTMKTLEVSDIIDSDNEVRVSMEGWHTGTVCSEVPFVIRKSDSENYNSYKPFTDGGGIISYKTSGEMVIGLDESQIVNSSTHKLDKEFVKEKTEHELDDRIVVCLHDLP